MAGRSSGSAPGSSGLGFGAWQIGGPHEVNGRVNGWGPVSREDALALVSLALELGVTFFDTAQGYGESESILGEARSRLALGPEITVCTKFSCEGLSDASNLRAALTARIDRSRTRLRQDCLDVVLLHNPPAACISEPFLEAMRELQAAGLFRAFGVSARTLEDVKSASRCGFGAWVEWNCSVFERRVEGEVLQALAAAGQRFIARSPLFRGLITDAFLARGPEVPFEQDVRVNLDAALRRWAHRQLIALAEVAHGFGLTTSEFALARLCALADIHVVIPGIRTRAHLDAVARVMRLDAAQRADIARVAPTWEPFWPGFA